MTRTLGLAAAPLLALAACSGGGEDAAEAPTPTPAATQAAAGPDGARVTPAYLAGEWCYQSFEAGGEISQENITYVFAADGSLKYQTSSSTPVDMDGSYALDEGVLAIKPALAAFKLVPLTVTDKGMVLEAMGGQFTWTRGACGG